MTTREGGSSLSASAISIGLASCAFAYPQQLIGSLCSWMLVPFQHLLGSEWDETRMVDVLHVHLSGHTREAAVGWDVLQDATVATTPVVSQRSVLEHFLHLWLIWFLACSGKKQAVMF